MSLPPYPTAPGMCFQNPAVRRYRAIKLIFPVFDQSNELTLGFLSERYVDARFWLNGRRYERVVDFYDTWLVESLEYSDDPFPLTLWWATLDLPKLAQPCVEISVGVTSNLVGRLGKFRQGFCRGQAQAESTVSLGTPAKASY